MMTTDILLVNPVFLSQNEAERELMSPYFPLGLLYLGQFLREQGFRPEIFDGTFAASVDDFTSILKKLGPELVGITTLQLNREMTLVLARIAHEHGVSVIMGGPDPTLAPEKYLHNPAVDIVVHHEGELTLFELLELNKVNGLQEVDLSSIQGIAYPKDHGDIQVNPRRPYILSLDELPIPARDLIDMEQYLKLWCDQNGYASLSISIARGCPYGCKLWESILRKQWFRQLGNSLSRLVFHQYFTRIAGRISSQRKNSTQFFVCLPPSVR